MALRAATRVCSAVPVRRVHYAAFLLRIPYVPGSNPGPKTGYLNLCHRGFSLSLQQNARVVPQIGHDRFLPHLIIHHHAIVTRCKP